MRIVKWLLPAMVLCAIPPVAWAQLNPWGGGPPAYGGGYPLGRPPGVPGLPGSYDPMGRLPGRPGLGAPGGNVPGLPGQNFGPTNPWDRPGLPGQNFGPGQLPGPNLPRQQLPPGIGVNPPGPGLNPWQKDKDRDEHPGPGLGMIPHIPHLLVPEFHEPALKPAAVGEVTSALRETGKGGGLLAVIGAAIAGLFRTLFGGKKKENNG